MEYTNGMLSPVCLDVFKREELTKYQGEAEPKSKSGLLGRLLTKLEDFYKHILPQLEKGEVLYIGIR